MAVLLHVTKKYDMSASCISLLTHPVYILLDYEENKREILISPIGLSLTVLETPIVQVC